MAINKDTVPELKDQSANASPECITEIHDVKMVIDRLNGLLGELDALGFPRAATYLSMAIDQIEVEFATNSK